MAHSLAPCSVLVLNKATAARVEMFELSSSASHPSIFRANDSH